jgi:hypothetical protein
MLPGMGEVRYSNGMSSNGLLSGAAERRFISTLAGQRAEHASRLAQLQATGSPNAQSRPVITVPLMQALAALPGAPRSAALTVRLAWAGNTLAAERQSVREMYQLRPVKNWGKLETYVTDFFGTDATLLKNTLGRQPIVSIYSVTPYIGEVQTPATAPVQQWEHVDTLERPNGTRWIISKTQTPSLRFAVTLYRRNGDNDDQVIRSDNLASERSAREYIRSYEVRVGDLAQVGRPARVAYWNGILGRGRDAGASGALARASRSGFSVVNALQPVDGLGVEPAALPAWGIAVLALGAVALLARNRYAGT